MSLKSLWNAIPWFAFQSEIIGDSVMKTLLTATCLLFIILFGFTLYTHYDTKKFINSLPQAPTKQRFVTAGEKTPTQREARTPENQAELTSEATPSVPDTHGHFHEHPDSHGHTHPHDSLVESSTVPEFDITQHIEETVEAPPGGEQLPPGVVSWKHVSPDGIVEIDRAAFLAEYGNHPEARTYLSLHRTIHTADSYTNKEFYEFYLLDKEFTKSDFPQSLLDKWRRLAESNPNERTRSYRSYKNDPKIAIIKNE